MLARMANTNGNISDESDDEDETCPCCIELLDEKGETKNFHPCPCNYRVCMFCVRRIQTEFDGRCPGCRRDYSEANFRFVDKPVSEKNKSATRGQGSKRGRNKDVKEPTNVRTNSGFGNVTQQQLADQLRQQQQSLRDNMQQAGQPPQNGAAAGSAGSVAPTPAQLRELANVRVVQKNLVYLVGLAPSIATEVILRSKDFFGQYGRIIKVAINREGGGQGSTDGAGRPPASSAYITFAREEDAKSAIKAVNGFSVDNYIIKASFGTTKYCNMFLQGRTCNNPDCLYLHKLGDDASSFTKEEMSRSGFHELTQGVATTAALGITGASTVSVAASTAAAAMLNQAQVGAKVSESQRRIAIAEAAQLAASQALATGRDPEEAAMAAIVKMLAVQDASKGPSATASAPTPGTSTSGTGAWGSPAAPISAAGGWASVAAGLSSSSASPAPVAQSAAPFAYDPSGPTPAAAAAMENKTKITPAANPSPASPSPPRPTPTPPPGLSITPPISSTPPPPGLEGASISMLQELRGIPLREYMASVHGKELKAPENRAPGRQNSMPPPSPDMFPKQGKDLMLAEVEKAIAQILLQQQPQLQQQMLMQQQLLQQQKFFQLQQQQQLKQQQQQPPPQHQQQQQPQLQQLKQQPMQQPMQNLSARAYQGGFPPNNSFPGNVDSYRLQ